MTPRPHSSALDALMLRPLAISRTEGLPSSVEGWRTEEFTFGAFLDASADPDVLGPPLFTAATLHRGSRDPRTVRTADMLVLDAPLSSRLEELAVGIEQLGVQCLVQTTDQHLRTTTQIKACEYDCWMELPPTEELLQWVMVHDLGIETEVASFAPSTHEGCPAFEVRHSPVTSYRLIFPLEARFDFGSTGELRDGLERWDQAIEAIGDALVTGWACYNRSPAKAFSLRACNPLLRFFDGRRISV